MAQPATNIRTTPTWSSPSYTPQKPTVVKSDQEAEDVNIKIGKIIFYITCALGSGFSIGLTASNALVSVSPTGRDTRPGSTLMHSTASGRSWFRVLLAEVDYEKFRICCSM